MGTKLAGDCVLFTSTLAESRQEKSVGVVPHATKLRVGGSLIDL